MQIKKIYQVLLSILVMGIGLTSLNLITNAKTQNGNALSAYRVANYRTVNNKNYARGKYTYKQTSAYQKNIFQSTPDTLKGVKGNGKTNFVTEYFLPVSYHKSGDFGNPQSVAIVNNYAYIMYTKHGGSNQGFIVRYDLAKLNALGGNKSGTMNILRQASWNQVANRLNSSDKKVLQAIKVGPTQYVGHGQSMAYNPKNKQMWFVLKTGIHAAIERVNLKTLKPYHRINFKLSSTVPMGENLTFDKRGNAYFYSYVSGGWAPKKSVKLYKGKITNNSVHFKLVMQGIRHAPGAIAQSIDYNPKNDNLYLISDGGVTRFPVKKLGHLSAKNVRTVITNQSREFEGLAFNKKGQGFLLVNKGPELMKMTKSNF